LRKDKRIFKLGIVTGLNLFVYDSTPNKQGMLARYNPNFKPSFLDIFLLNSTLVNSNSYQDISKQCSGINSCISDSLITGLTTFGVQTKNSLSVQVKRDNLLTFKPPVVVFQNNTIPVNWKGLSNRIAVNGIYVGFTITNLNVNSPLSINYQANGDLLGSIQNVLASPGSQSFEFLYTPQLNVLPDIR